MIFNEDSRVKIPAILHLMRLGYQYIPFANQNRIESNNIFPAIFIESIYRINNIDIQDAQRIIHGPHKVATELFSNISLGSTFTIGWIPKVETLGIIHISKSRRFGLNEKFNTDDDFYNKPLRFIGHFEKSISSVHKVSIPHLERIIVEEFQNKRITDIDLVKKILDYVPKKIRN